MDLVEPVTRTLDHEQREGALTVAQVFDTWGRLSNTYNVPEAFLLVFRVGGQLVRLPEDVSLGGHRLVINVVDLAPTRETGSRAKKPPMLLGVDDLRSKPKGGKGSR